MTGIVVSVLPPTNLGRLYPRYDEGAGILIVESRIQRPWPFGVDIDGGIVFDLDGQRLLANFDLHIPKSRWKVDLEDEIPRIATPGNLVFTHAATAIKSFSLPLRVRTNSFRRRVRIEIGESHPDREIALSSSCTALLSAGELVGFTVKDFV